MLLVAVAELPLDQLAVELELLELGLVPADLLVLLVDQALDRPRRLQEMLVVLTDLPLQLLLLQFTIHLVIRHMGRTKSKGIAYDNV